MQPLLATYLVMMMSWTTEHATLAPAKPATPGLSKTIGNVNPVPSDGLLQASRRLDWRFLLPDPNLERVAYIGQPTGSLLSALKLFSRSVRVCEPAGTGERRVRRAQYDVVVTRDPTIWVLQQAVALVRPGGCLYVEAHGPLRSLKTLVRSGLRAEWGRPRLGRPLDYITAIQQLGLSEAEPFWFWPNFEACTKIIPLHEQTALLHALAPYRAADSARGRWQALGGRWLVKQLAHTRLLELAVPCFGIVAR